MKNHSINPTFQIKQAVQYLNIGGIIAYPTETVFGLGCDPMNAMAVASLLVLKQRSISKGVILIAADLPALQHYIHIPDSVRMRQILASWPGPTTWIFPAQEWVPEILRGAHSGIAVRISSHPKAKALCQHWGGALVSTSANISGRPVVRNALLLQRWFGRRVDFILPGQAGHLQAPSRICDAITGQVVRE